MKCFKCKNESPDNNIIGDGNHESIKGKHYCEKHYWTPSRKADLKKNSVSLVEYINNPNIFKDWGIK